MHCSSFERLLDAYVDGELPTALAAKVAAHVESCSGCAGVLAELRVIDGLLLAPRRIELAPNFTFAVMAEARALPAPRPHANYHLAVLGTYVVFGWVAIAAFLIFGGHAARAMVAQLGSWGLYAGATFTRLSLVSGHLFGRTAYDVTAAVGGLIALDLLGAAFVVALYARLRERRLSTGSDAC